MSDVISTADSVPGKSSDKSPGLNPGSNKRWSRRVASDTVVFLDVFAILIGLVATSWLHTVSPLGHRESALALMEIGLAAAMLGAAVASVAAAESPSFTAYAQGQYMTARKLAETEAAQGSKEAYTLLGEIYEEGLGVAQDYTKAAEPYRKAADLGEPLLQLEHQREVPLHGLGVLQRMCLRKRRQASDLLAHLRIVLHRARAERIKSGIDPEVALRQCQVVPHHIDLRQFW